MPGPATPGSATPGPATPGSATPGPVGGAPAGGALDSRPRVPALGSRLRVTALGSTALLVLAGTFLLTGPGRTVPSDGAGGASPGARSSPAPGSPAVGRAAPDVIATTVDGSPVSLAGLRGRPVWLTFGATWCAPCRSEAPEIQAAQAAAGDDGVVVIAVYLSEDPATVRDFARRLGLRYRQIADPDRRIGSAFGVSAMPTHYFVDRSGILRAVRTGALPPDGIAAHLAQIGG